MESTETEPHSLRAIHGGLFFTAMAVLLLEVALTRVFAILMWHHFAYMVVSLALLGFGASGSLLTALGIGKLKTGTASLLSAFAGLFAVTLVGAYFAVTRISVDSLEIWNAPSNFLLLLLTYLILSVPFLFAGCAIGTTLSRYPKRVGSLYFIDLVGSAVGGALAPLLLGAVGPSATVIIAAMAAMIGSLIYAFGANRRSLVQSAVGTLAIGILVVGFLGGGPLIPAIDWKIPFAPHKGAHVFFDRAETDRTLYSSTAQVDVTKPFLSNMEIGGQFGDVDRQKVMIRYVTQDGTAPTAIHLNASDLDSFPSLDDAQPGTGYECFRARKDPVKDVLVIGVGGGIDVMVALKYGAERVQAAEINSAMVRMVEEVYAEDLGHLFEDERVQLHHAEGRSFLRRSSDRFDIIQLSGVDTYTALSSGAYTLSESYLYTVEAIKDLYEHLTEDGIVNYSRFILTYSDQDGPKRPRETIRLANIAATGLREMGIEEPWRHIAVFQADRAASTMIKRSPFTEEELAHLDAFAEREGFMGFVFDPRKPVDGPFAKGRPAHYHYESNLHQAFRKVGWDPTLIGSDPSATAAAEAYRSVLRMSLTEGKEKAKETLTQLLTASVGPQATEGQLLEILSSSVEEFVDSRASYDKTFAQAQSDFAQLLKSDEEERERFIDENLFDLEPSRDDKPFFFNYFKLSRLPDYLGRNTQSWDAEYHPEFPVGHMVIAASLLQIVALAALLILLPLRRLKKLGEATPHRWRTFLYFSALGLGFMFVEIGLMQRFILFLGHPTLSLSVVLSGMLAFSGFGALLSSRIKEPNAETMTKILALILGLIILELIATNLFLDSLLGIDLAWRVVVVLLLILPLGIGLGLPFPMGLRYLEKHAGVLIPWGWAVNGFLSVMGSMMVPLVAMKVGFTSVVVIAGFIYAIGFLLGPWNARHA